MMKGTLRREYRDALLKLIDQSRFIGAEAEAIVHIKEQLNDFEEEKEVTLP